MLRRVRVQTRDVVFLKGVLEASEGLAIMFAQRGGDLTIATTVGQENELDRTLSDLSSELDGMLLEKSVLPSGDFREQ